MELIIIVALAAVVIGLLIILYQETELRKRNTRQWQKWEAEYWLLRQHAEEHLNIHVSWLPRGVDECIKPKETK